VLSQNGSAIPAFSSMNISQSSALPLSFSDISISTEFIMMFSIIFMATSSILGSMVLGLVGRGKAKEGAKYIIPLIVASIAVFFVIREAMLSLLGGMFGMG